MPWKRNAYPDPMSTLINSALFNRVVQAVRRTNVTVRIPRIMCLKHRDVSSFATTAKMSKMKHPGAATRATQPRQSLGCGVAGFTNGFCTDQSKGVFELADAQATDVANQISRVDADIEQLGDQLTAVENTIEIMACSLLQESESIRITLGRESLAALREREQQLRDEKKQLRQKESQLRDQQMQLLLLKRDSEQIHVAQPAPLNAETGSLRPVVNDTQQAEHSDEEKRSLVQELQRLKHALTVEKDVRATENRNALAAATSYERLERKTQMMRTPSRIDEPVQLQQGTVKSDRHVPIQKSLVDDNPYGMSF